jgi:hypothetical protein
MTVQNAETLMRSFPEKGVGVVLACNAEGARNLEGLLAKILDMVLPTNE